MFIVHEPTDQEYIKFDEYLMKDKNQIRNSK